MKLAIFVVGILVSLTCLGQRNKPYEEDLSVMRPKFVIPVDTMTKNNPVYEERPMVTPVLTVNEKVDAVLDSIDKLNRHRKFVEGFTIQIYSGQNREEANNTKKKMADELPDMRADLHYIQPKFRVKTGAYFTRLEAQPDLVRLRRQFPNAILVPERIPIR